MTYAALREFLEHRMQTAHFYQAQTRIATPESGSMSFLPLFQTCTVKGQPPPEGSQEKEK
jgi:hypothetical protein